MDLRKLCEISNHMIFVVRLLSLEAVLIERNICPRMVLAHLGNALHDQDFHNHLS